MAGEDNLHIEGSMGPELGEALRRVEQRVESVEDALESAGRSGEKAGERIDRGATSAAEGMARARRAAGQAQRALDETAAAAERTEDGLRGAGQSGQTAAAGFAAARRASEQAAAALGRAERAAEDAAEALDDAGDEAAEAGAQAAASAGGWNRLWRALDRNERMTRAWTRAQSLVRWDTYTRGADRFRESWRRINDLDWKGLQNKVNRTARSFGRFRYALMAIKFTLIIGGILALTGLLSSLGAGLVAATGALLGMTKGFVAFLPVALAGVLAVKAFSLAAEALAPELDSIKKQFSGLGEAVARGGLRTGLRNLSADMGDFADVTDAGFARIGAALGRGASRLGQYLAQQDTLSRFDRIYAGMQPILDALVDSVLNLAAAFVNVLDAATPVGRRLSDDLEQLTFKFRAWTDEASASGEMTASIDRGYTQLVRTVTTLSNFVVGLSNIFRIGGMHAGWMGDGIEGMAQRFKDWTNSFAGQISISTYFRDAMPAIRETLLLLRDLIVGFAELATNADLAPMIAKIRTELLPVFSDLTGKIALDLGPAVLDLAIALGTLFGSIDTTAVQYVVLALVGLAQGIVWLIDNVPGASFVISGLVTAMLLLGPAFTVVGWGIGIFGQLRTVIMGIGMVLAPLVGVLGGWGAIWAAMTGPIGIAILVIGALVAAFVWAYNNVAWFRDGVNAALSAVGGFFVTAWNDYIWPVLQWLWTALKFVGAIIFTVLVAPFVIAWNILSALFLWAYNSAIAPVLGWIGDKFNWLNTNVVQPVLGWIGARWAEMSANMKITNDTVIQPTLQWVGDKLNWLYQNIVLPILGWIRAEWEKMAFAFQIVKTSVIDPVFSSIGTGLGVLQEWFRSAVDGMGAKWAELRGYLAAPINFVIDKVWNNGILKVWNWVAEKLGLPVGQPLALVPQFREGGPIRGAGTGTSDSIVARVSAGEHVWTAAEVDAAGGHNNVLAMRRAARDGKLRRRMAAFAGGGPVSPQEMYGVVRGQFPGARMTSGFRPGDPGYHGRNRAVDLAGARGGDGAAMRAIDTFIGNRYPGSSELIYTPGPYNIKDGRPHSYSAAVRADHYDHVHWAANGAAEGDAGGGGLFGWIAGAVWDWAKPILSGMIDPVIDSIPFRSPPQFMDIPRAMARTAKDQMFAWAERKLNEWGGAGDPSSGAGYTGAGVERWRGTVMQALSMLSLPGSLSGSTLRRMNQESGGNPRAINLWDSNAKRGTPSKGLMQVIDPTFRANYDPRTPNDIWNPLSNVVASMRYTLRRYGSLPAGYDRRGGYDNGGMLMPGDWATYNHTGKPEPVLTAPQWATMSDISAAAGAMVGRDWTVADPSDYIAAMHATAPSDAARAASAREDRILAGLADIAAAIDERPPALAVSGDETRRAVLAALEQRDRQAEARGRYRYAD